MSAIDRFSLALSKPLQTARETIDAREGFLVAIDVDGIRGVGEATPLPGWTESLEACENTLDHALDIAETDGWNAALETLDVPAARHGLSLALCDARSRAANLPLYRHLGDEHTEQIPVNATIGDGTVDRTVQEATTAVEIGFRTVKVKVGARAIEVDVERLRAVREAVGSAIALRADANGAWSRDEARTALGEFADLDIAYVEQPLSPTDLAGHAALRGEVNIALDETLATHSVERVLDADVADVLVLKPMALGGPNRTREAALAARESGIEAVLTTTVDGALARAGAVHVAASLPDVPACGLATVDRLEEDLIADPVPVENGHMRVPQGPGNVSVSSLEGR